MITRFYIHNFKSLVNFELDMAKFTCLIGLNGAGKSTVLQALDFVSTLMSGRIDDWLNKRGWEAKDLLSKPLIPAPAGDLSSKIDWRNKIRIKVDVLVEERNYVWRGVFDRRELRCTEEQLEDLEDEKVIFSVRDNKYVHYGISVFPITFEYQGSLLSQLKSEHLAHPIDKHLGNPIQKFKESLIALHSLDLLSPHLLRMKSRKQDIMDIGAGGENLSAFIHRLSKNKRLKLLQALQNYYPQITKIQTRVLQGGWIKLEFAEEYDDGGVEIKTEAKHVNDGTLRLLAILAQQYSPLETLLFDEIENGINPEVIEKVVDALVASPKQIIVTTHSPMLLNYMTDEVAKEAVMLIYKRADGATHATRFFDVPSVARKLESLPPGSAMLDVYLDQVAKEVERHHAA